MASGGSESSGIGSTRPISREQVERNTYGGMTSRQLFGGEKDWLGTSGVYDGAYGGDEGIPDYQAPIPIEVVKSGNVEERLNKTFGVAPKSLVAQQTADLAAGIWNGIKAIPGGVMSGLATVADGYRGLGYLVTGNIGSFQPRFNVTFDGLALGLVENSPVGVLRGMLDNDYRAAGNRLTGTVVGLGSSYAMPYLTKVPGVGVTASGSSLTFVHCLNHPPLCVLDRSLLGRRRQCHLTVPSAALLGPAWPVWAQATMPTSAVALARPTSWDNWKPVISKV